MLKMLLAVAIVAGLCLSWLAAQPNPSAGNSNPGVDDLWKILAEPIAVNDFPQDRPLTFTEFLTQLREWFKRKGNDLPVVVQYEAFREENPDAPSIDDTPVKFAPFPRRLPCGQLLRRALDYVVTNNATFLVRPGVIDVTTLARATPEMLLGQTVHVKFYRRPLEDALEDLYQMTGVAVILDRRVGLLARTPVTATLSNGITLGTALLLMTESAGLKLLVGDNAIFVTTPPLAVQFLWERANNPFGLPPL